MERILQEIQDFRKENSRQLGDIKDELNKTNQKSVRQRIALKQWKPGC